MSSTTRPHWLLLGVSLVSSAALVVANLRCTTRTAGVPLHAPSAVAPVEWRLYARKVIVDPSLGQSARAAAEDLATLLARATRTKFELVTAQGRGIQLLRTSSASAPADLVEQLKELGPEAYALRSRGDGRLLIVANGDAGLVFGTYQLLERLGFRFYFPNDRWTVIPRLSDIEQPLDLVVRPAFRKRRFAGTGGFGKNLAVDPLGTLEARWQTWMQRNGFGEEFHTAGHAGEAFNLRNKEALLSHPDFLASVQGQRVKWSKSAKLDPSNPEAVALFVRDRVEAYEEQLRRDPSGANSFAVSVEPADGGGHCDSPACERIGGPSEQQFYLANAVARELAKRHPGAHASIYAYNKHADVPQLEIEPNVYVTLIPYAFRGNSADPPESFIRAWSRKKSPLSIYDYWSIPDWTADLPELDYRSTPAKKLRFWREQNIEGFVSESTYSAGAMGLAWYIAGHLMWDLSRDPARLAEDFFAGSFGAAAPPMRRMLERWATGFMLTRSELHASFEDLSEAFARSPSEEVSARLGDYALYLQYLRLRHDYLEAEPEQEAARKRRLIIHLWRMYASGMVHTFRLQKLLLRGETELAAELDPQRGDLPVWREVEPPRDAELREMVAQGLRDFPERAVELKRYEGELTTSGGVSEREPVADLGAAITLVGANRVELTVPIGVDELGLELSSTMELQARVLGEDQQELAFTELQGSDNPTRVTVKLARPGTYFLDLRTPKRGTITLRTPPRVGVELQEFRIPASAPVDLYFFVPHAEKRVAIYSRSPLRPSEKRGVQLLDASGRAVPAELGDAGHVLTADVPPGQDGKVWTLKRAVAPNASLRLLNAPQRFALSPRALRVPAGALRPVGGGAPSKRP